MYVYQASVAPGYYYTPRPVTPMPYMATKSRPKDKPPESPAFETENNFSPIPLAKKLFGYVGPSQAAALFAAGLGASFATRWFVDALRLNNKPVTNLVKNPLEEMIGAAANKEKQISLQYPSGPLSALMFALNSNNSSIQSRLKGYLGAMVSGYFLGSAVQGVQEIWVRREETHIRANLLGQLTGHFRQSLQYKANLDRALTQKAQVRILEILQNHHVPYAEELVYPQPKTTAPTQYRYASEPVHFDQPIKLSGARFGKNNSDNNTADSNAINQPAALRWAKTLIFGLGYTTGMLGQAVMGAVRHPSTAAKLASRTPGLKDTYMEIINATNFEALMLGVSNKKLLWAVLGLGAIAKIGKVLVDGYREIEVTRQHAQTELRYQHHNWLALDPAYHNIAEEEALDESLRKLKQALPYEAHNRKALGERVQTILGNIGRNSTPKYMPMTPYVNLAAARS